jgi:hypothetical protein
MAMTRETFARLGLEVHWARAVTDDLVVMARCQAAGLPVHFTPGAMVVSAPLGRLDDLFRWAVRQSQLVRLVRPLVWLKGFAVANGFAGFYLLTPLLLLWPGPHGGRWLPLAGLLGFALTSVARSRLRYRVLFALFPGRREQLRRLPWGYDALLPLADFAIPWVAYASLRRSIRWRGVSYRVQGGRVVRM